MKKLALFDFCETLVSFQTADAFVDFVREKDDRFSMHILNAALIILSKFKIIALFNKLFPMAGFGKKLKLLQLKGIGFEKLTKYAKQYYIDKIKPELISQVVDEMKNLKLQNYEIGLVSAGYSIYLKYFAEEYKINHLISTEIAFSRTKIRCLGTISGKDCIRDEKPIRIKTHFLNQNINYKESISYSDSLSDLPMLLLTGSGVVVSESNSQHWAKQYKFKEIIWHKK